YKLSDCGDKTHRCECAKVLIGTERNNHDSLKDAAKTQNKAEDYVNLIRAWREAEVATHVGYILGFPHDTKESLRSDLQRLMKEIQVQQASFFILTPLPGSRDHLDMSRRRDSLEHDYRKYDPMR